MTFFRELIGKRNIDVHDGRPLWRYNLDDSEFEALTDYLRQIRFRIPEKEAAFYYAEWWRRCYKGGSPSKESIFKSLYFNSTARFTPEDLYQASRNGASQLGIKWIRKNSTLYFRTMLLQGGLPLVHISMNQNAYQKFLNAILYLQPNSIDDIIAHSEITSLLPSSSQNENVYENCLIIIQAILNDDRRFDDLLSSNDAISKISEELKIKKRSLTSRNITRKPKIYWILKKIDNSATVKLKIALANDYSATTMQYMFDLKDLPDENAYKLFVADQFICVFRRRLNGCYKTEWVSNDIITIPTVNNDPTAFLASDLGRLDISGIIDNGPDFDTPSLWVHLGDNIWRYIKGTSIKNDDAHILVPEKWMGIPEYSDLVQVSNHSYHWFKIEESIALYQANKSLKFSSNIDTFEWLVISQKPQWMASANMTVIQNKPTIFVFDDHGNTISSAKYKVYYKTDHQSLTHWQDFSRVVNCPIGIIHLKIVKEDSIVYDECYNIGNVSFKTVSATLQKAEITVQNETGCQISLSENGLLNINKERNIYKLNLDIENCLIPKYIKGAIKKGNQKTLQFDLYSPFRGVGLLDSLGNIMNNGSTLALNKLQGYQILTPLDKSSLLRLYYQPTEKKNDIVYINYTEHLNGRGINEFKDDLNRLFYLGDAMRHNNTLSIELRSGLDKRSFWIKKFDCTLNVDHVLDGYISINENIEKNIKLLAIPLNTNRDNFTVIALAQSNENFSLETIPSGQYIIVSDPESNNQLQPRFINTDILYLPYTTEDRILKYQHNLEGQSISDAAWSEVIQYFELCRLYKIPYSTFDQLRALVSSEEVAAKAFFYLLINQYDPEEFIQMVIPNLEKDLGFCFFWISKKIWEHTIDELLTHYSDSYFPNFIQYISLYFQTINMVSLGAYIIQGTITDTKVSKADLQRFRSRLGDRVLRDLPNYIPYITSSYRIFIDQNIKILVYSPIVIAESILGKLPTEKTLWGYSPFKDKLRRNIQYIQSLSPELYNQVIAHVLSYQN